MPGRPRFRDDRRGEYGPAALLLFLGGLIAATAGTAIWMQTTQDYQHTATNAGRENAAFLAVELHVESIVGKREAATGPLQTLELYVQLDGGSPPVDLALLKAEVDIGGSAVRFSYANLPASDDEYNATILDDADGSYSATNPILTGGDRVRLTFSLSAARLELDPRTYVQVFLYPEKGRPHLEDFETPAAYGTRLLVELA